MDLAGVVGPGHLGRGGRAGHNNVNNNKIIVTSGAGSSIASWACVGDLLVG